MITYFEEKNIIIEQLIKMGNVLESKATNAIINISVYYPSCDRNNLLTRKYVNDMAGVLKKVISDKLAWEVFRDSSDGPMVFLGVNEDVILLKKLMTYFEDNHVLGKWMVMEVFDNVDNAVITRDMLGIPKRTCSICNSTLNGCMENKMHSDFEIIREINRAYVEFTEGIG